MADFESLVIRVKDQSKPAGKPQEWAPLGNMATFTKDILTPTLAKGADMSAIVSGIPTIFARINLFTNAISYIQDTRGAENAENDGLMKYYVDLVSEWRGFLACLAFDYKNIRVDRIELAYSDGADIAATNNLYEPKGAFGNMLFERKPLWCIQTQDGNKKQVPFIDVIRYKDNIVAATSPDSLFFTSAAYTIKEDKPFVNATTGKFMDPIGIVDLPTAQLLDLYAYVQHITTHLSRLEKYYSNLDEGIRPNYSNLRANLTTWLDEIKQRIAEKDGDTRTASVAPVDNFNLPFSLVFNYSSKLFGKEGVISTTGGDGAIEFDPKEILLRKDAEIAQIILPLEVANDPNRLKELPVHVLKAKTKGMEGRITFFALPLSALGLNVFGKNIGALVGTDSDTVINSRLTAIYDPASKVDNLEVSLIIETKDGQQKEMKEAYTVKGDSWIRGRDLVIWPNFISKQWKRYFMYSELPHNDDTPGCSFRATPLLGTNTTLGDFRIITDKQGSPLLVTQNGGINIPKDPEFEDVDVQLLVTSDNRVSDNRYKYEVYESNKPFMGVRLSSGGKESGYLIIKYTGSDNSPLPKNRMNVDEQLSPVDIGVDFGSTNTSLAYCNNAHHEQAYPLNLTNRRVSLLNDKRSQVVAVNDLLFFQNVDVEGNAVKSMLALHDLKRLKVSANENGQSGMLSKEVKGGFPCMETNLPVDSVSEKLIKLAYHNSIGEISLVYNMKWSDSEGDKANKKAFLNTLMLEIYAELFQKRMFPQNLKWSYPSSMGSSLIMQYEEIWQVLKNVNPLVWINTEADYALHISSGNVAMNVNGATMWEDMATDRNSQGQAGWGNSASSWDNGGDTWGSATPESQPMAGSWGTQPAENSWETQETGQPGGWGNSQPTSRAAVELKPDDGPVEFEFQPVNTNNSMTEACAVANYVAGNQAFGADINAMTLCFDIGGSTTDISVLSTVPDSNGKAGTAMLKQSSIRFAAQRVSNATKYSPNFKRVLLDVCSQFNLKVQGLTPGMGDDKYSPETAPFFFEQIVNKLSIEQLAVFYRMISADCPELMCVNLYVTGLISYYAGQITNKLITEIRRSNLNRPNWTPKVSITFAGKGARIFDWFMSLQEDNARKYYQEMFIRGMGGMQAAQKFLFGPPIFVFNVGTDNVKYEVSMGLARNSTNNTLLVAKNEKVIEILGEENFFIQNASGEMIPLSFDNSITCEMMDYTGTYFMNSLQRANPQAPCPRFMDFADLFYKVSANLFGLKMKPQEFMMGFQNMNMNNYIQNLPEYRAAKQTARQNSKKFDFVMPIIILEGMKFYDDYLLKGINHN